MVNSMTKPLYRIGVDVGGTNTDAVILSTAGHTETHGILASFKHATTADVTEGIEKAVRQVLALSQIEPSQVCAITIGTTHFINAVLERDQTRLRPVAVLRLCTRFTRSTPPFVTFPPKLKQIMCGYFAYCDGGCNIDGSQIKAIDPSQIRQEAQEIRARGIRTVVVNGVYSSIDETFRQEEQVSAILEQEIPGINVVRSRDIAQLGLLERENASILNASILEFARETIRGFEAVLDRLNLACGLYLTQNDGTVVEAATAAQLPIKTFSSGATNSMRGAAFLAGISSEQLDKGAIVVDIGGTTTDVGMLLPSGFPRQAPAYVDVAGVRLNFCMPDLTSIPLGGGSIVRESASGVTVGPDSVGYKLTQDSRVFGGATLTTTDIVVRERAVSIGDPALVDDITNELSSAARMEISRLLAAVVDQMKISPEPIPVMLVGGGSIIAPASLPGASVVLRPAHHDVANAVGAAIAKISGTVDTIEHVGDRTTDQIVQQCRERAIQRCVDAGALASTVTVAEIATIPIQYISNQLRIVVRCTGEIDVERLSQAKQREKRSLAPTQAERVEPPTMTAATKKDCEKEVRDEIEMIDLDTYRPHITASREWLLSALDLKFLEIGTYVLGCAGGGSPFPEYLQLRDMLSKGHKIVIVETDRIEDDQTVLWGGFMGSPAVSTERLGGEEVVDATQELLSLLGMSHDDYHAVMSLEIGGGNGLQPLIVGSTKFLGRPCLDCDWMGRAYPTYYQTTLTVHKQGQLVPAAIASGDGKTLFMTRTTDDVIVDVALRAACSEMGSRVGMAAKPCSGALVKQFAVRNTMSLAWRIGRCVSLVADRLVAEVGGCKTARKVFVGKIVRCESKLYKGHSYGSIVIAPLSNGEQLDTHQSNNHHHDSATNGCVTPMRNTGLVRIPYKNENILIEHFPSWSALEATESPHATATARVGEVLVSVPDLIAVLDAASGENLGVPEFRYGLKVVVVAMTASTLWSHTKRGLELGGPAAFGYGDVVTHKPLGIYTEPRSVIDEFAPE